MNNFNKFKLKADKINKHITDNNRYKKLLLKTKLEKNNFLNGNVISKNKEIHTVDKIKMKYGFLLSLSPQFAYNKIQSLKNKYLNNNISSINKYNNCANLKMSSYIPHNIDNITFSHKNSNSSNSNSNCNSFSIMALNNNQNSTNNSNIRYSKNNFFRSSSLQFVKENNFNFNNSYNKLKNKKRTELKENNAINHRNNNIYNFFQKESKTTKNNNNNPKFGQNFKYLRNTREDFISVDKKLNEILKSDAFNSKRKQFNIIFPISKKIIMLNEVKKDINNLKKKTFNSLLNLKITKTGDSFFTSYTSDFPRNHSENNLNMFYELFNDEKENNNIINNKNEINKPILIKSLPKPKLNVPKYLKFL